MEGRIQPGGSAERAATNAHAATITMTIDRPCRCVYGRACSVVLNKYWLWKSV
jgi:hypothetical protein